MKNFNRGGDFGKNRGNFEHRGSGSRGLGGRDFGHGRAGFRSEMHKAICAECGSPCEVPFRPSSGKPVFCNNCFSKTERRRGGISAQSDRVTGVNSMSREQFEMLNAKLDKILLVLSPMAQAEKALSKESLKKDVAQLENIVKTEAKNVLQKIAKKVAPKKPVAIKKNKKK